MLLQLTSLMPGSKRPLPISRYNSIDGQQSGAGKEAAGGCPSVPGSGARLPQLPAPAHGAGAAPTSQC